MAYKQNGVTIVDNNGNWTDRSFDSVSDISATETTQTVSTANSSFGRGAGATQGRFFILGNGDLHVFNLDGTYVSRTTNVPMRVIGDTPASFREGRIVVGNIGNQFTTFPGEVNVYNTDGTLVTTITASDGANNDQFGGAVAVGNGKIVVAANNTSYSGFTSVGSIYIYDLDGSNEIRVNIPETPSSFQYWGSEVAVGNGRIFVSDTLGGNNPEAVYMFTLDGKLIKKITSSQTTEFFGRDGIVAENGYVIIRSLGNTHIFDLNGDNEVIISTEYQTQIANGKLYAKPLNSDSSIQIYNLDGTLEQDTGITYPTSSFTTFSRTVYRDKLYIAAGNSGETSGTVYIYDLPETTDTYWENIIEGFRW